MDAVSIEAKVIDNAHPPFWSKATLQGCQFDSFRGGEQDRIITGQAKVAPYTLLTFRIAGGDMDDMFEDFWIVCVDPNQPEQILGDTNSGYLNGQFEIVAHGKGEMKASRLRTWWFEWAPANGGQTTQMARWLVQQLNQRREVPAPCPSSLAEVDNAKMFRPIEAWTFAPIKWA